MEDDQTQDNVNEEVVDQTQDDAQEQIQEEVQEEAQDSQEETQESEEQETQEEDVQEEKPQPSHREQLRINKLLEKYGNPYESQAPQQTGIDYRNMIDADDDTYKQLEQASVQAQQAAYQQAAAHAEYLNWHTGLKIETPKVHEDFPQMNNERVRDSINQQYLAFVGYQPGDPTKGVKPSIARPDVSFYDFVAAKDEEAREIAEAMTETTRRNVTRQASRTGLRPDGSSAKKLDLSKPPEAMTDEELDAIISKQGFAPKKR